MTGNSHSTGETLEQLLERVIFEDPVTHGLRAEWERTKAEEQAVFERVCREEYEDRKMYHEICKTPNPEVVARQETNLLRPMLKEELDARLAERWEIIRRKVAAASAASDETPGAAVRPAPETVPAHNWVTVAVRRQHAAAATAVARIIRCRHSHRLIDEHKAKDRHELRRWTGAQHQKQSVRRDSDRQWR